MKRTIFINLAGRSFNIEEEAQVKLAQYLDSIKRHCGPDVDAEEVIADIEASISDKLKATLNEYKEVITLQDIDELIGVMGTTDDFDRTVGTGEEAPKTRVQRKLYRDVDHAIVGGVASGLGAYFNIDPVLFRLIFVGLVFAGGSGFLLYLIMWAITPAAKSAHEKLEMQGEAPTIAAFEKLAKAGAKAGEKIKKSWRDKDLNRVAALPFSILENIFQALKRLFLALWPIVRISAGLIIILTALIILGFLGTSATYLILQTGSNYSFMFIPISELTGALPYFWLVLTVSLSAIIPTIILLLIGLSLLRKKSLITFASFGILASLWIISTSIAVGLGLRYAPEIKDKVDTYPPLQQVEKSQAVGRADKLIATGRQLRVNVVIASSTQKLTMKGRQADISLIEVTENNGLIEINQKNGNETACIACDPRTVTVELSLPAIKNVQTNGADINIEKPKDSLELRASASGDIEITGSDLASLILDASEADVSIAGHVASSTLSATRGEVSLSEFDGDSLNAMLSDEYGRLVINGGLKSLKLQTTASCRRCELDASEAKIASVALDAKGSPVMIIGSPEKLDAQVSSESSLFYSGQPKMSGDLKNKNVLRYGKISASSYEDRRFNDADSSDLYEADGRYYEFFPDQLSDPAYDRLLNDFRQAIR